MKRNTKIILLLILIIGLIGLGITILKFVTEAIIVILSDVAILFFIIIVIEEIKERINS